MASSCRTHRRARPISPVGVANDCPNYRTTSQSGWSPIGYARFFQPSNRRHDLLVKKPYYARIGVPFHRLVDLAGRTVTAYRLEGGHWLELGTWGDETDARIEPFAAIAIDVKRWWP